MRGRVGSAVAALARWLLAPPSVEVATAPLLSASEMPRLSHDDLLAVILVRSGWISVTTIWPHPSGRTALIVQHQRPAERCPANDPLPARCSPIPLRRKPPTASPSSGALVDTGPI